MALFFADSAVASSGTATVGQSVTFSVTVNGTAPFTYQWYKDGAAINGANRATYAIGAAAKPDAGTYTVVVANSAGSTTSDSAVLTVTGAASAPAVAPTITTQPATQTVTAGSSVSFTVAASGTAPLTYQWRKAGAAIGGANSATYQIGSAQATDSGTYSVVVSNPVGSAVSTGANLTVSAAATPTPAPTSATPSATARLINLSSRTQVGTGDNLTIAGFVVSGAAPKTLLIRGVGPALANMGVDGVLPTPTLTVYSGSTVVASNEGWTQTDANRIRATAQQVGAFALPEDGRDCAVVADFAAGIYTVHLHDKGDGTGIGLIELYDASTAQASRLVNLSTRAFVGRDASILISGLVVAGPGPRTFLLRAIGPGLVSMGVSGVLSQPNMVLLSGSQTIAANTGWSTAANRAAVASAAAQVGAFPLDANSADSAILATLSTGIYSILVSGADGGSGTAMVEIYEAPAQ